MKKVQVVCIVMLLATSAVAQLSQIRFENLDVRDGLSHNRVTSIYQDQMGFMWFGTLSGLNRYDGSNIHVIRYAENDPYSLGNPNIVWVKEGPEGKIWIKTSYGVFAYDIYKERFVDISRYLNQMQVDNYNLQDVVKDSVDNYWFVIEGVGLKKYLSREDTVYHYGGAYRDVTAVVSDWSGNVSIIHDDGEIEVVDVKDHLKNTLIRYPDHLKNISGLTATIDKDGHYWFYSSSSPFGLCYFVPGSRDCKHFGERELGSQLVTGVLQDASDYIVIGADHGGLTVISKESWARQRFEYSPYDPKSLSHSTLISLYQDRWGLIWIGTNKGGVNYYSPKAVSFNYFKQADNSVSDVNDVLPIVEDEKGNLWFGTDGGGLVYFDMESGEFTNYMHDPKNSSSLSSDIIVSMSRAADGGLWIGTYLGGLNYYDGKRFRHYYRNPDDPNSLCDNSIWNLFLDSKDQLWVGTLKGGIDVYDREFQKRYHFERGSINSNYITSICEDLDGKIWIGTGYGVEVFDPETEQFVHYLRQEGNAGTLSNNSVIDIYCDSNNNIWVGTMHGVNLFDRDSSAFLVKYTKNEGLSDNIITSIVEDESGNMWFGTYQGLTKMLRDGGNVLFENYDISNGLQGDMFNERSALRTSGGKLVFGGKNGINVFDPEKVDVQRKRSQLVFLSFNLANHRIRPDEEYNGRTWFENGLNNTERLTLKHYENSFSLEFTSLNFYQQDNIVYGYRLVGFDDEWIEKTDVHSANFTNLDPGDYRFEVRASDQRGQWNSEPLVMNITVLAPFWQTPLAYLLYMGVILVLLLFTRRAIIQKERFRAKVEHDQFEARRLHELDMLKIKFFTNISHEFRTPLTLILTPIERLLKTSENPEQKRDFQMIFRNAQRLLALVNQLLDFRKMEANQHRLSPATGDLIGFIKNVTESFSDLSNEKRIRLEFESFAPEFYTTFDADKFEKIMLNLLSNAFKFTHSGGKVTVRVEDVARVMDRHTIRVSVQDTGIGIPADRLQDVFSRFFQVENGQRLNLNHGSGIGLSITKEFVEMHGGKVWAESELEVGSTFILEVPMKKLDQAHPTDDVEWVEEEVEVHSVSDHRPTVLLAEDNNDFRFYLRDNLKQYYNMMEAHNGKAAWKKIVNQPPDLVVTDIMMPEISGIELCRKIKSDPRTAHVPVILLTAHYSDEQKLEGFEAGAIEYITKPFNFEILVSSIKSAIQLQKLIHEVEHRREVKPREIEITSLDDQFVSKAIALVEENISNPNFSVMELSRELAVSRGQLYKKLLELTGKTPIEFIRALRMARAAALLTKSQLNVAEVAYKVGFNNPKYFAKYFKMEYHMLPSRYAAMHAEKSDKVED